MVSSYFVAQSRSRQGKNPNLKIIVSDPRKTQTCAIADVHFQLNPGTDITLHHAIGRCLIEEGRTDIYFVQKPHAEGFEKYRSTVFERTITEAAIICGIAEEDIRLAAAYIGSARGFITMWTMGLNQSVIGVNKNLSLINLNLITGHIGKPGSGAIITNRAAQCHGRPEKSGRFRISFPPTGILIMKITESEVEKFWRIPAGNFSGAWPTATEMFEALHSGKLKAIWIIGTNPLISLPDVRMAEEALKKAKFVVVQEISQKAETLLYADVVLPAATWTEKEGTMTNAERRISYLEKVVEPPGEALPDAEIICRFARKMGFSAFTYKNSREIYEEHTRLTRGTHIDISGLDYNILKHNRTIQWALTMLLRIHYLPNTSSPTNGFTRPVKRRLSIHSPMPTSRKHFPLISPWY